MNKKNNNCHFMDTLHYFTTLSEVTNLLHTHGASAYGVLLYTIDFMRHSRNAVAPTTHLKLVMHGCHTKMGRLLEVMVASRLFVIDECRGVFYSPKLRKLLHMPATPTDEEIDDVLSRRCPDNYLKDVRRSMKKCTVKRSVSVSLTDEKVTERGAENAQKTRTISPESQIVRTQHTDNKHVADRSSNSSSKITFGNRKRNLTMTYNPDSADADVLNFEKILSDMNWRLSVAELTGVRLDDSAVFATFVKWLDNYCRARDKQPENAADLRAYGARLLHHGRRTREDFMAYLRAGSISHMLDAAEGERIIDGERYDLYGVRVPEYAEHAPAVGYRWSCVFKAWILATQYDQLRREWKR